MNQFSYPLPFRWLHVSIKTIKPPIRNIYNSQCCKRRLEIRSGSKFCATSILWVCVIKVKYLSVQGCPAMGYYVGDKNDAFDFGFWLFSCSGYHPKRRSLGYRLVYPFISLGTIVVILVSVQQAIATSNNISDFVQNFESASVFIMVSQLKTIKLCLCLSIRVHYLTTYISTVTLGPWI